MHRPTIRNAHTYNYLGHSILAELTNFTRVKYSVAPQPYKVVKTHYHEISGWKILSRLLHASNPNLGYMNGDVQYGLAPMEFKNGENLEDFHSKIIRLQQ